MTPDLRRIHDALDNLARGAPEGGVIAATSAAQMRAIRDALNDLGAATAEIRAGLAPTDGT